MEEFYILLFKLFLLEAYLWEHNEVKGVSLSFKAASASQTHHAISPPPASRPLFCLLGMGFSFILTLWKRMDPKLRSRAHHFTPNVDTPKTDVSRFKGSLLTPSANRHKGNTGATPPLGRLWTQILTARVTKDESMDLELPTKKDFSPGHTHFYWPYLNGLVVSWLLFYD